MQDSESESQERERRMTDRDACAIYVCPLVWKRILIDSIDVHLIGHWELLSYYALISCIQKVNQMEEDEQFTYAFTWIFFKTVLPFIKIEIGDTT
jgi:hypothetical protein